jgi:hypothetical protein
MGLHSFQKDLPPAQQDDQLKARSKCRVGRKRVLFLGQTVGKHKKVVDNHKKVVETGAKDPKQEFLVRAAFLPRVLEQNV